MVYSRAGMVVDFSMARPVRNDHVSVGWIPSSLTALAYLHTTSQSRLLRRWTLGHRNVWKGSPTLCQSRWSWSSFLANRFVLVAHLPSNQGQFSRIFLKTEVFLLFGVAFTRKRGFRKRSPEWRFSKTFSRVVVFENAVIVFTCGRVKTKVYENDDVIIGSSLHRRGFCQWFGVSK